MTSQELREQRRALHIKSIINKHTEFAMYYRNLQLAISEIRSCGESSFKLIDAKWNDRLLRLCITNYAGKLKLHKNYEATWKYLIALEQQEPLY